MLVKFFVGQVPSMATNVHSDSAGVMISATRLWTRKSDFAVGDWIMDSGGFTVLQRGGYDTVENYARLVRRWKQCGNLLAAVSQDYMCEPMILQATGLTVPEHQRLTIERYASLVAMETGADIMPVLQGYRVSDYVQHVMDYGDRLSHGAWTGVGSVCRRNGRPDEVADILRAIKLVRPDLRLHGFGLKLTALQHPQVEAMLYSADSMAWAAKARYDNVRNHTELTERAMDYQNRIHNPVARKVPRTAGAGNGQGRKAKWKSETVAVRVPSKYAERLVEIAREWEEHGHA